MNNYLVVPGGIVATKSCIAVGFSSQFSNCQLRPDGKQHSRHDDVERKCDLTKRPLLRITCKSVRGRDARNALFFSGKKLARLSIVTAGRRIPKSERQFRFSVSIKYRMTHENGFGLICITSFAWAIAWFVKVLSAIGDSLHLYLRLAAVHPMTFTGNGTLSVSVS